MKKTEISRTQADDFIIADETTLASELDFQTVDRTPQAEVNNFVSDVDSHADTRVHFSRNPYVRLGIGIAVIAFVFGFGIISTFGGRQRQVAQTELQPQETETEELSLSLEESEVQESDSGDVEALRSELALLQQQMAMAEIDRSNAASITPSTPTTATQPVQPSTTAVPASTPMPTPPRPVPVRTVTPTPVARTVVTPRQPAPRPVVSPSKVVTAPTTPPVARKPASAQPNYTPVDPEQAWLAASNSGVFGSMPPAPPEPQAEIAEPNFIEEPQYQLKTASFTEPSEQFIPRSNNESSSSSIPGLHSQAPVMGSTPLAPIVPMQSVNATVATPISWLLDDDQFTIELDSGIENSLGEQVIPAGSLAIVQPVTVDESSGYAQLAVVGFNVNDELIPVDFEVVRVRGEGGNPLIADRYGDVGGDIASNDMEMFAIGALGGIGQVLTRPESSSSVSGTFGTSSTSTYGDRNILGAVLAGGTEELTGRMGERNDQRLAEIRSRDVIFYLPKGKGVEIYINQEFQL